MLHPSIKFVIIFLFILVSGCREEDFISPAPNSKKILKIIQNSSDYNIFTYSNDRLMRFQTFSSGENNFSISLFYTESNFLRREERSYNKQLQSFDFHYDEKLRISSSDFAIEGTNIYYLKYYYDQKNRLIKNEQYRKDESIPLFRTEYNYDQNDNVIEKRVYDETDLIQKHTYRYDGKINPYYEIRNNLFYDYTFSKNNVLEEYDTLYYGITPYTMTIKNVYTYDEYGYPSSKISDVEESGNKKSIAVTYHYQN